MFDVKKMSSKSWTILDTKTPSSKFDTILDMEKKYEVKANVR